MLLIFKVAAIPIGIVVLFLIYWILPNRRIPPARVAPVAILAGLVLEAMKYVFLLIWPLLHIKLERIAQSLDPLEADFRPLARALPPETEPAIAFHAAMPAAAEDAE